MIELILNKIRIDETHNEQMIVLREKEGERYLPLVIGLSEVHAIKLKLTGMKPPRPMTHDLILEIMKKMGGIPERVTIDKLEENTFYAKWVMKDSEGNEMMIDARPSDCIALALRAKVPIFVAPEVMEQASLEEF